MSRLKSILLTVLFLVLIFEIVVIAPKKLGQRTALENQIAARSAAEKELLKHSRRFRGEQAKSSDGNPSLGDQTMKGVHLVEASSGTREWELDSDVAQGFKDGVWKLQGVRVNLFGKNNTEYKVVGETGAVNTATKNMEISGNVVTQSSDGYTFKSPSILYNSASRKLSTPGQVQVFGPKNNGEFFEFQGKVFEADLNTNVMHIAQEVHAIKTVLDDKKVMNIHSQWCRVQGKSNEAHFEKDVRVDIGTVRITGEMADFMYDEANKNLKSMIMSGSVKITDEGRWATAEQVKVMFAQDEFVLLGHPRVVLDDNELRGEEIHFLDGGKRVKVIRARARLDSEEVRTYK